jgi:ribonuclease E
MANKMLIDATHPEETRVVVLRGNRVEEFDFESAHRKQLRGNIYLAKVTRVEPSLQAAFVDYGGNRHGFLAFSEIHPDYYQIPVADREALIAEEERAQRAAEDEVDRRSRRHRQHPAHPAARHDDVVRGEAADAAAEEPAEHAVLPPEEAGETAIQAPTVEIVGGAAGDSAEPASSESEAAEFSRPAAEPLPVEILHAAAGDETEADEDADEPLGTLAEAAPETDAAETEPIAVEEHPLGGPAVDHLEEIPISGAAENGEPATLTEIQEENGEEAEVVESVGGADALEEVPDRAPRFRRQYKIQEVIKRRQVMLVQVVKEERGTKGAALTTYLSLAGRYSVLMPNTARGGGISRKITNAEDRARLKEAAAELEVPEGMGVILRTAGANRTKIEIKRDFEYLLRMWETVRDLTLKSTAPKLVYEEGSLVKRSIRDLYTKDIEDVIVAGVDGYNEAKDFMRMLMPSHAKNVKLYTDTQPLLSRYGVENQLDAMFSPVVQLRSGGYVVLNQTEALVAIDVNSGRATREHHIEDTALKTNLEAADEIARQLRLRDLAGLIVIDFIDMDEKRNNRAVERRLKECLKHDRARIQVGRISHFGLLEMSRQRIRTSVLESSTEKCPYCGGSGHVRSVSSLALQVLRALEEQLIKGATHNLIARTRPDVALYVLNQKRAHLRALEERFAITITVSADETVAAPQAFVIDRGEQVHTVEAAKALAERMPAAAAPLEDEDDLEDLLAIEDEDAESAGELAPAATMPEQGEAGSRRRRRRRRGGRNGGDQGSPYEQSRDEQPDYEQAREHVAIGPPGDDFAADDEARADEENGQSGFVQQDRGESGQPHRDGGERRRRRGRRGGRRNRQRHGEVGHAPGQEHGQEYRQERGYEPTHEGNDDAGARNSEMTYAAADESTAPSSAEPELHQAVADLDKPFAPHVPESPEPSASGAPAQEREPVRRRSTVREPAPVATENGSASPEPAPPASPAPEPIITGTGDAAEAERPRRTGWWSRRFAGGG